MTNYAWKQFFAELCLYFDRKEPKEGTFNLWFEELKEIPDSDLPNISARIKRLEWPKINFPAKIFEIWNSVKEEKHKDFLIDMIERTAKDCQIDLLEAFYDLRHPIKVKEVNIGPAVRWLQDLGYRVDMARLNDPCIPREPFKLFEDKIPF